MIIKQWLIAIFSVFTLVTAGLLAPVAVAAEDQDRRGTDCIFIRSISDYTPLDRDSLIIWAPTRQRAYLVTLAIPTTGLDSSFGIAFKSRDGRLCPYGGDAIITDDPIRSRHTILSISRLSEEDAEALLDRRRGEDGEADEIIETEESDESPDAEVEELG